VTNLFIKFLPIIPFSFWINQYFAQVVFVNWSNFADFIWSLFGKKMETILRNIRNSKREPNKDPSRRPKVVPSYSSMLIQIVKLFLLLVSK
jgi:hypothetical protein